MGLEFRHVVPLEGASLLEFRAGGCTRRFWRSGICLWMGSCPLDGGKNGTPSLDRLVGPLDGWVLRQMGLWIEPLLCCTLLKNL